MNVYKVLVVFVVGVALGVAGGGFIGYTLGSSDRRVDEAYRTEILEVQEERRPTPAPPTEEVPDVPEEVPDVPEEVPDVPEGVDEAEVVEITEEEIPAETVVEAYSVTPNMESDIMWVGYKRVLGQRLSMEGGFANFEGTLTIQDEDPDESFVEVIVDMNTVFSENAILTQVLRTDAFFDVEDHPQARFASTKIEESDNGYLVTGNFTLRGVTHGIQFPAKIERRGDNVYVSAEFTIDRKRWDVGYDAYEDSVILSEVVIAFEIMAEPV